jgi:hypothetical protein
MILSAGALRALREWAEAAWRGVLTSYNHELRKVVCCALGHFEEYNEARTRVRLAMDEKITEG